MTHRLIEDKEYAGPVNLNVLRMLPSNALTILDIGCGTGNMARHLSEQGRVVDGITLSESEAKLAGRFCRNVAVHNLELGLPDGLAEGYDAIICSHVIEHIVSPTKLLKDIREKMTPDTTVLLLAIPNTVNYKIRAHFLLGRFDYAEAGIMDYSHVRWYTLKSGRELLTQYGFKIRTVSVGGDLPCRSLFNWMPSSLISAIKRLLHQFSPGLFGQELLYLAAR